MKKSQFEGLIKELVLVEATKMSKNFSKAVEAYKAVEMQMQSLVNNFVAEKDPKKKAKLKVDLKTLTQKKKQIEKAFNAALASEPVELEEAIKYKKGKTYQTGKNWSVYMSSGEPHFSITVNSSAGWSTDPNNRNSLRLLDAGKVRATLPFKEGNIDKLAKKMHDLTRETTYGEKESLSSKDYADILRVWIDMGMQINESTESWEKALKQMAKDKQLKMISKKDKETLLKIAKMMKSANESSTEKDDKEDKDILLGKVYEGKYDHLMGKEFKLKGKEYYINSIEDNRFAHVSDKRKNTSTFRLDFLVKNVPGFTLDKPKKARGPAWNKGQKTTSKREYEKILKAAMKDARGMGDVEFTHDMATSMIHDPEIQSYINKANPGFRGNKRKMIQRLQWDLEMYESVNESDNWKTVKIKSGDTLKPGKKYKIPRYGVEVTFIKFDRDNKTMHLKSNKIGKIRTSIDNAKDMVLVESVNEAAYKNATNNELAQYIINLSNEKAAAKSQGNSKEVKYLEKDIEELKKELKSRKKK